MHDSTVERISTRAVHAAQHVGTHPERTSLFVAITLCGGGLLMRQTLARDALR